MFETYQLGQILKVRSILQYKTCMSSIQLLFNYLKLQHTWSYLTHLTFIRSFKHRDNFERKWSISYNSKELLHATKWAIVPAKLLCKKVYQINSQPSFDEKELFFPSLSQREAGW